MTCGCERDLMCPLSLLAAHNSIHPLPTFTAVTDCSSGAGETAAHNEILICRAGESEKILKYHGSFLLQFTVPV